MGVAAAKWKPIGIALKFDPYVLEIISTMPENIARGPQACFSDLLTRWLKWAPPARDNPTLAILVAALRSEIVEEFSLAAELERNFKGKCIISVAQTYSVDVIFAATSMISVEAQVSDTLLVITSHMVEEVQLQISQFEDDFKALKRSTRAEFERRNISVKSVVECLTDLSADEMPDHKIFLEANVHILFQADGHLELFASLNFYWNYLAYHLLEHIIKEFHLGEVKTRMDRYKSDLQVFRKNTLLRVFCRAQKQRRAKPPPDFVLMVAEYKWPENVTLEVVEEFRQEFVWHYNLRDCAMMLNTVREGSFHVAFFVSESVVEHLTTKMANQLLSSHNVIKLEIAETCFRMLYDRSEAVEVCMW